MASSSSSHFVTSFLIAFFISCDIFSSTSAARDLAQKTNNEFLKTSCSATTYPKLCLTSLSSHANAIQTSPKLMANEALTVTLASSKSTSIMMLKLSQSHGMKPREVGAMRDCIQELSDSVDAIQRSIAEMGNFRSSDFQLMISDVQTWVSAALTDETTCSDGFGGNLMNGNLKTVVRGRIVNIAQLTSNSLALVNRYASVQVARNDAQKTNNEFMKTSCSATTYPKLCLASLSSHAGAIQTSPKLMACAALNVTLASAKSTSTMMSKLSHSHGMEPKEVEAMRDCVEELSDSVYELKRSIAEMGSFENSDFQLMISDVQTWVSAALTDETTCSDGFEENGMNGKLKTIVGGRIVKIAQLTSNALALINRYASVHG